MTTLSQNMIKKIECRGTPYEVGFIHGSAATEEIERCINFYAGFFLEKSKQSWPQVKETAKSFDLEIRAKWPRFHQELQGIADGSKRDLLDIVAINVRTEIAFGLFSDGCTSLFWHTSNHEFLAQNWDWVEAQKQNLIALSIYQDSLPTIKMITEAGIVGKIGFNSAGVGVCLNAIRAKRLDASRMPVHLGLRTVLKSSSTKEAVAKLTEAGMAASAHMLIVDGSGDATGLEFTSSTFAELPVNAQGRIIHTNHLILPHEGAHEVPWLKDSVERVERMAYLTDKFEGKEPTWPEVSRLFEDRDGLPGAICRSQELPSTSATLFNIVMDLKGKHAVVRMGKPCDVEESFKLSFE
ncbi:Acyl-coenzyme A:6-aminopenicillanic-acid-acyltransferase 40 kDa form [Lachnellula suecica]|uniref:Acyl-coenzyme A:6-aminopenicillanic-acid-acyltransferase 40 kDa form n=1 Tax=Lachnellula suecica TaxID=602035 RepID=A0A8T9C6F3_9HELO|nr:Acyl-coenzyme A:6-aminopenicillanic-acid-acyltransferase 40 kDa form [Lachnellula suecica]